MAVVFRTPDPTCTPASLQLPGQVRVVQHLAATMGTEKATCVYSLSSAHNICFEVGAALEKATTRKEEVPGVTTRFTHILKLAAKGGGPSVKTVTITETVTGASGPPKVQVYKVTIL